MKLKTTYDKPTDDIILESMREKLRTFPEDPEQDRMLTPSLGLPLFTESCSLTHCSTGTRILLWFRSEVFPKSPCVRTTLECLEVKWLGYGTFSLSVH